MELIRTKVWQYALAMSAVLFLILMGGWWYYLVIKLSTATLKTAHDPQAAKILSMMKWEGPFFLLIMLLLLLGLIGLLFRDHRKSKSLHAFFSTLTHELKTPLASIRLQGEVLNELVQESKQGEINIDEIDKYTRRLNEDTSNLELQLEKSLQLSRIEEGGPLNLGSVHIVEFIQANAKDFPLSLHIKCESSPMILADNFALKLILKNLLENTLVHNAKASIVNIDISEYGKYLRLQYNDDGNKFEGNIKKLTSLFYKYNSPHGSGVGLYLIKKLIYRMRGHLKILERPNLIFQIDLLKDSNHE